MKAAVLDLGTNTFQLGLYIVEPGPNLVFVEQDEVFVKMTKESATKVVPAMRKRAVEALKRFIHQIDAYHPDILVAVGTEAFRTLAEGRALQQELSELLEEPIHIISGEEEARWTCEAVQLALPDEQHFLLMDIGGGSTELTWCKDGNIQWARSFPIGAAVMAERFDAYDTLDAQKADRAAKWLAEQLSETIAEVKKYGQPLMVGTSGSFETIPELQHPGQSFYTLCGDQPATRLKVTTVHEVLDPIMNSTLQQRLDWPGLKPARAEYFLMAAFQARWVMEQLGATALVISKYGLREGALLQQLTAQNSPPESHA